MIKNMRTRHELFEEAAETIQRMQEAMLVRQSLCDDYLEQIAISRDSLARIQAECRGPVGSQPGRDDFGAVRQQDINSPP